MVKYSLRCSRQEVRKFLESLLHPYRLGWLLLHRSDLWPRLRWGIPPHIFSTGIEPLARMTQYLTDKNMIWAICLGQRSKITIPSRGLISQSYTINKRLTPQRNKGVTRASDPEPTKKRTQKVPLPPPLPPLYRSLGGLAQILRKQTVTTDM